MTGKSVNVEHFSVIISIPASSNISIFSYSETSLIDISGAATESANPVLAQVSILVGLEAKSLFKSFAWK